MLTGWTSRRHQLPKLQASQCPGNDPQTQKHLQYSTLSLTRKKSFSHILACAAYYYQETDRTPKIHLTYSLSLQIICDDDEVPESSDSRTVITKGVPGLSNPKRMKQKSDNSEADMAVFATLSQYTNSLYPTECNKDQKSELTCGMLQ